METIEEVKRYLQEFILREQGYELKLTERGNTELAHDCHRRVFTLELVLEAIGGE